MRRSVFVWCLSVCLGCGTPGGGPADDSDDAGRRAEEQARSLAAPHEAKGRDCEAEGKLREALKHYVAAIQALPEGNATAKDFELREKSIRIVLSLDPPPAISEDVQQMFDRAEATAKAAKDDTGWSGAAREYERALRYAPWEARGNYNLGLMYELLKKGDLAVRYLKLYLLAAPGGSDREHVGKKIAELEVRARSGGVGALAGTWEYWQLWHIRGGGSELKRVDTHAMRIEVRDKWIFMIEVILVDNPGASNLQKGDELPYGRFTMDGRKLRSHCLRHSGCSACPGEKAGSAKPVMKHDQPDKRHSSDCPYLPGVFCDLMRGMVSEDFNEITIEYCIDFEHGKETGNDSAGVWAKTVLRRSK